jgi:hypothetical protein
MPIQVDDITTLQNYLTGVCERADEHGENVQYVVIALAGAIVLYKDCDYSIRAMSREGTTANVLWVRIGNSQYAFSYDHESQSVVLKNGTTHGEVLAHFTNATTIPEILEIFDGLLQ